MRLMDGLLKDNAVLRELYRSVALWSQNESPAPQSRQFLNRSLLRSLPMIMNLG